MNSSRLRILIAEDERAVCLAIKNLLSKCGRWEVLTAVDGETALAIARGGIDIALVDICLVGDLDGFEVCRLIKEEPLSAHAAIVHMSGSRASTEDRVKALRSGSDVFLKKPVHPKELLSHIEAMERRILARRRDLRLGSKIPLIMTLADSLSHAISNPLFAIRLAAYNLNKIEERGASGISPGDNRDTARHLASIEASGSAIARVVADLNAIALGRDSVNPTGVDGDRLSLGRLLGIVETLTRLRFESLGIKVMVADEAQSSGNAAGTGSGVEPGEVVHCPSPAGVVCGVLAALDDAVAWLSNPDRSGAADSVHGSDDDLLFLRLGLASSGNHGPFKVVAARTVIVIEAWREPATSLPPTLALKYPEDVKPNAIAQDDWSPGLEEAHFFCEASGGRLSAYNEGQKRLVRIELGSRQTVKSKAS